MTSRTTAGAGSNGQPPTFTLVSHPTVPLPAVSIPPVLVSTPPSSPILARSLLRTSTSPFQTAPPIPLVGSQMAAISPPSLTRTARTSPCLVPSIADSSLSPSSPYLVLTRLLVLSPWATQKEGMAKHAVVLSLGLTIASSLGFCKCCFFRDLVHEFGGPCPLIKVPGHCFKSLNATEPGKSGAGSSTKTDSILINIFYSVIVVVALVGFL
ncbi:hypothetical protein T439DRAFT_44218 [Meredithblackwellia eburnea MCA 4105]